jgi:hypothetical protein
MSDEYWDYKPNLNGELTIYNTQIWTNSKGQIHREDGPAREYINGRRKEEYYIHNREITKDEWLQYLKSGQSSLDQKTLNRIILENS